MVAFSEELLEVLDESGQPTGEIKSRSAIHRDGDWHRTVCIVILNPNNELLLERRSHKKDISPGKWTIAVAGHIAAGQTSQTSALQELREELGLKVDDHQLEFLFTIASANIADNSTDRLYENIFDDMYLYQADIDLTRLTLQEEEVSEVKFVPFAQFEQAILNNEPDFSGREARDKRIIAWYHQRFGK